MEFGNEFRTGRAVRAGRADHVVVTDEQELPAEVAKITAGRGVDIAFDCIAGSMSEKIVQSIRPRGHWIVYGLLDTLGEFPWWPMFTRSLRFDVFVVFAWTGNRHLGLPGNEEAYREAKRIIETGLEDGSLPVLPIDREFKGIESLPEAMTYMSRNQGAGKIVITLKSPHPENETHINAGHIGLKLAEPMPLVPPVTSATLLANVFMECPR
jgi:NADPH:quinone reductase-like Zn-dependent oxidoreductase